MQLIDTVIAQGKKDSLTDYLKGVYAERFGLPIEIRVMYKEPKESTLKYNDMRLQQEVDSILDQVEAVQKQKEEKKQEKERRKRNQIPKGECLYFDEAYERGMRLLELDLSKLDVNMFSAVDNRLINDGCGLYRGRLILPYEHLSRFQNDLID